jgi:hypothetical protein
VNIFKVLFSSKKVSGESKLFISLVSAVVIMMTAKSKGVGNMSLLEKIVESSTIKYLGQSYRVLGKAIYSTRNDPDSTYVKVLLENHHILVIVPDEMAYFGVNKGCISEFDSFSDIIFYQGQKLTKVNHDYQVRLSLEFGSPTEVEGNVEFWDYEIDDTIISIAEIEGTKERADVVAKYIEFEDFDVI